MTQHISSQHHLNIIPSHPIPSILISSELHTRLLVGREFNFSYISGLNILKPGIATGPISSKNCMPETRASIFHALFRHIQLKRTGSLCKISCESKGQTSSIEKRGGFLVTMNPNPTEVRPVLGLRHILWRLKLLCCLLRF